MVDITFFLNVINLTLIVDNRGLYGLIVIAQIAIFESLTFSLASGFYVASSHFVCRPTQDLLKKQ